jgi:hypothetical protein
MAFQSTDDDMPELPDLTVSKALHAHIHHTTQALQDVALNCAEYLQTGRSFQRKSRSKSEDDVELPEDPEARARMEEISETVNKHSAIPGLNRLKDDISRSRDNPSGYAINTSSLSDLLELCEAINHLGMLQQSSVVPVDPMERCRLAASIHELIGMGESGQVGTVGSGGPDHSLRHLLIEHKNELLDLADTITRTLPVHTHLRNELQEETRKLRSGNRSSPQK